MAEATDFIPYMSMIKNLTGGSKSDSGGSDAAVQKALAAERARQAKEKADRERKMLYIALGTIGFLGLGGITVLILRKRK